MLRLHFNKIILIGLLIPYAFCAQGVKDSMPERKKPIQSNIPPKPIGNSEYIVGTEKEFNNDVWTELLRSFGPYQLELIVKNNPAYKITFKEDPGLEKLKLELKQNPEIRYVEPNSRLEKKN